MVWCVGAQTTGQTAKHAQDPALATGCGSCPHNTSVGCVNWMESIGKTGGAGSLSSGIFNVRSLECQKQKVTPSYLHRREFHAHGHLQHLPRCSVLPELSMLYTGHGFNLAIVNGVFHERPECTDSDTCLFLFLLTNVIMVSHLRAKSVCLMH